ncbi:hypothetical protein [Stappia sp. WLB 29]|uniref:thermonuclease family protein n=1 Tax=Stappia sp. WLB 29 TaxID=2925220 RepID=UPI0020BDADA5|nr:hypothetical protein [Stappia sp. WLB 29]
MRMQGFETRGADVLRWLAPVVAMVLGAAVGIAFAAVVLSQGAMAQETVRPVPVPVPAPSLAVCRGGDRAARHVTCVVDGDTFWLRGTKHRLACVDAAEMDSRGGIEARRVLARVLADPAARVTPAGRQGRYGRELSRVVSTAGDAERVLVGAGLARRVDYRSTRDVCRRAGW